MSLPIFKYHPDPMASGSIEPSDTTCACCEQPRGYIYTGSVYSTEQLDEQLCPWCIADGSAHTKFDAEFTDSEGIGGYDSDVPLPTPVVEEVAFRTPGF